jgi:hypothetical protein
MEAPCLGSLLDFAQWNSFLTDFNLYFLPEINHNCEHSSEFCES